MATEYVMVHNQDANEFEEDFRGKNIVIPSGGAVKMSRSDANLFMGQYSGFYGEKYKGTRLYGQLKVKNLVMKPIGPETQAKEIFVCNVDGKKFDTKAELDKHLELHKDKAIKDESEPVDPSVKMYPCPFCAREFDTKQGVKVHITRCKEKD